MTDLQTKAPSNLKERAYRELMAIVERYSEAEASVVRAYFAKPHTNEEHIEVLLKQMGREIQGRQWADAVVPMARDLERGVDRHDYVTYLRENAEEAEHYTLLADIAEWLNGGPLPADRLLGYEVVARYDPNLPEWIVFKSKLPEAIRNVEVGREIVAALGQQRGRELMHLAEGGGGGAFVEAAKLQGDEFKDRLAAAMRKIAHDEMGHGPGRVEGYVQERINTEEELEQDKRWLDAFMMAHFRVRNEIWGYPLSDDQIAAVQRGEAPARD
jgi:hypothetical protein